jgi:hypothetical protein
LAGHLKLSLQQFAAPGNVEILDIETVGGVSATLTHFQEKAKTAVSEYGSLIEVESVPNVNGNKEKSLVNLARVQNVIEF